MQIINQEKDGKYKSNLEGKKGVFTVKTQKKIQRESKKGIFKVLELEGTVKYKGDNDQDVEKDIKITSAKNFVTENAEGIKTNKGGPLFVTTARNGGEFFHKDGVVVALAKALNIYNTDEFPSQKIVVENTGFWEIDLETMMDGNHTKEMLEEGEKPKKMSSKKNVVQEMITTETISDKAEA